VSYDISIEKIYNILTDKIKAQDMNLRFEKLFQVNNIIY